MERDMRYTLTPDERADVEALKERCDDQGIKYKSIFELAKYCLVSSSIKDTKKRRNDSFQRIKKKRAFEEKHRLDELDLLEAIRDVDENLPNWAIPCGKVNEKWCIGYTSKATNIEYMNKSVRKLFKVELNRYDLAAADLEEARRGFYIVGTARDLKANPLRCVRTAVRLKPLFDKMNANRVKGIFHAVPRAIVLVSNIFLSVVPKTVRERMNLVSSLEKSKLWKEHRDEVEDNIHTLLGGKYNQTLEDWFTERLEARKRSDELVSLV